MSQGSHHQETLPVAPPPPTPPPPAPCIPPIKNLLLLKYDPIKILSRPSLLEGLGGHTATNQIKANHNVASQPIELVPIFSSVGAASPVVKKKFPPPSCTITSASQISVNDKDSSLMPPPRAPSAPRTKQARSVTFVEREPQPSTSKKCMQAYLTASTSLSSSSTDAATAGTNNNVNVNNQRKRGFPYIYPKLDLVTKKKRKIVKYVNNGGKTCSAKKLRLATISFAVQNSSASAERLKNIKMKLKKYTRNLSTRYKSKQGKPKIKVKVKGPRKKVKVKGKVKKSSGQQKSQQSQAQKIKSSTAKHASSAPTSSTTSKVVGRKLPKQKQKQVKQKVKKSVKKSVGKKKKVVGRRGDKKKTLPLPLNIKWFRRKGSSQGRGTPCKIPENHLVNHTIELLRHKRDLQTRVELIEDESVVYKVDELPKIKEPIPKGQLLIPNIPITGGQAKEIIQNRLPILLAHGGYTHVNERPLEVLADVMENFYMKMAHRLKQVREMEMSGCEQEFPDPLERVMVEMNLGGVRGVEEYYTSRVMDYRKRVEEQCVYLRKLYAHKIRLKCDNGNSLWTRGPDGFLIPVRPGAEFKTDKSENAAAAPIFEIAIPSATPKTSKSRKHKNKSRKSGHSSPTKSNEKDKPSTAASKVTKSKPSTSSSTNATSSKPPKQKSSKSKHKSASGSSAGTSKSSSSNATTSSSHHHRKNKSASTTPKTNPAPTSTAAAATTTTTATTAASKGHSSNNGSTPTTASKNTNFATNNKSGTSGHKDRPPAQPLIPKQQLSSSSLRK